MYARAAAAMLIVKEESECHSQDRFSLRAQKDPCGIGVKSDQFRFAVDKNFNVTYWPYIQTEYTYKCVRRFFSDSFDVIILSNSIKLTTAVAAAVVSMVISQ